MSCQGCKNIEHDQQRAKRDKLLPKFIAEATSAGLDSFAILKTVNKNPGFMWRKKGHPDCERLGVHEIYFIEANAAS